MVRVRVRVRAKVRVRVRGGLGLGSGFGLGLSLGIGLGFNRVRRHIQRAVHEQFPHRQEHDTPARHPGVAYAWGDLNGCVGLGLGLA